MATIKKATVSTGRGYQRDRPKAKPTAMGWDGCGVLGAVMLELGVGSIELMNLMADIKALFGKLGIEDVNAGASTGADHWIRDENGGRVVSINSSTGEPLASVLLSTPDTCDRVVAASTEAFRAWREDSG